MLGVAVVVIAVTCMAAMYLWLRGHHQFWKKRGVPFLEPDSLFFGNFRDAFNHELSMAAIVRRHYNQLAPVKYGGVYLALRPVLYVLNPELIERILIDDFRHFADRNFNTVNERDPLSLHLFAMSGEAWNALRHKLTPTLTTSKIQMRFRLMKDCVREMEYIVEQSVLAQETVDVKELMARYIADAISSCAFGHKADSLSITNSQFRFNRKPMFTPSFKRKLYNFLLYSFPKLLWMVGYPPLPRKLTDFFVNLINNTTVNYPKICLIFRNNFSNLLMDLHEEENGNLDFNLAVQCYLFYLAGFEMSCGTLSFILYELAEHPDVQEKLQEEIDRVLAEHYGEISYDCLQEMHYMDKVFNETSRLFPALPFLQRICTRHYHVPDSDWVVTKGQTVFIPVQGLHRDSKYYPNPDEFNPENFSEEAKASRPPCTFLPFGDGPRNCTGNRLSVVLVKLALASLLRRYTVTISPQMKLPVTTKPGAIVATSKEDILLNFNRRKNKSSLPRNMFY